MTNTINNAITNIKINWIIDKVFSIEIKNVGWSLIKRIKFAFALLFNREMRLLLPELNIYDNRNQKNRKIEK